MHYIKKLIDWARCELKKKIRWGLLKRKKCRRLKRLEQSWQRYKGCWRRREQRRQNMQKEKQTTKAVWKKSSKQLKPSNILVSHRMSAKMRSVFVTACWPWVLILMQTTTQGTWSYNQSAMQWPEMLTCSLTTTSLHVLYISLRTSNPQQKRSRLCWPCHLVKARAESLLLCFTWCWKNMSQVSLSCLATRL